jgi:pimeloyl-ACP methyl ester carboxylesterase
MWRPQLEHVPAGCRFIAPNLRGFGQTELLAPEGGPITMDDYASDVSTLLDCLKIEDATIGGLSMGGYVTFAAPAVAGRVQRDDSRGHAVAESTRRRNSTGVPICASCSRRRGRRRWRTS